METRKITAEELNNKLNENECIIIDVREPDEYNFEHIPGSINTPLSSLDASALNKLYGDSPCIITCKSGKRSEDATQNIKSDNVFILEGGLDSWKKCKLTVTKPKKQQFPTMRLVQIIAGSMVLIFSLLALYNKVFLLVPIFVGAGLTFAGATGWCGLAIMVNKIRKMNAGKTCSTN